MKDLFTGRKYTVIALLVVATVGLLVRLFILQVAKDTYRLSADNNVLRYETQYPARGVIYDRNGKIVVSNMAAYDLMVMPSQVRKNFDTTSFCRLLGITPDVFRERMKAATVYSRMAPSVFLKQISDQTYAGFQEKMFLFPGFYVQPRTLRKYTLPVAAHLLGYVSEVDEALIKKDPYYKAGDYIGKSGIEETYEKYLRGKKGVKISLVDVFSRVKGSYANGAKDTLAIQGSDLTCTIDLDLQAYGEQLMKNKRGSIVAIEPKTGEVLALVSAPDYDPGLLVGRVRAENFARLNSDTLHTPLFNRALMALYPPGSTFKPLNGMIGLQEGVIIPETTFECHQGYAFVKCHVHRSPLDLRDAVANSCNAYFCQTYKRVLENPKYNSCNDAYVKWKEYVNEFGFGNKLGTDFINELPGFIPAPTYYDKYYGKNRWHAMTVISMAIGQGEVLATPIQLANMTATIANRGYYYIPHVIKAIGQDTLIDQRFLTKHAVGISADNIAVIADGMERSVKEGTSIVAQIKDIVVCGKTGTAQNPHGKDHSVFIAFAPKDDPKIAICVFVENAGFGATTAAPIASMLIEKYLKGEVSNKAQEQRIMELDMENNNIAKVEQKH